MLHDLTSHISTSTWHVFWVFQFLPRCFLPPLTFFYTTLFSSCQIDWHKGKDVTVKTIKKKQKHKGRGTVRTVTKQVPNDSFFNFFNPIKGENLHRNRRSSLRLHRISIQVKNSDSYTWFVSHILVNALHCLHLFGTRPFFIRSYTVKTAKEQHSLACLTANMFICKTDYMQPCLSCFFSHCIELTLAAGGAWLLHYFSCDAVDVPEML